MALVRVTHPAEQPPDSVEAQYDNGQKMWWRYRAPTEPINSGGVIPRTVFLPLSARTRHIPSAGLEKTIPV